MDEKRTEGQPHDRLTRLCAVMTDALDADRERGDEKAVVFLQDGRQSGLQMHGYENDSDALVDVLMHLRAILRSKGNDLRVIVQDSGPDPSMPTFWDRS
jgi:hypothetical protein